jgi:hypothetical protein
MPATQPDARPAARERDREHLNAVIGTHVLRALGQPGDRFRVVVKRLWDDHYRVNVLVGADVTTTTIAHSYFLVADGDGNVSGATPTIKRRY